MTVPPIEQEDECEELDEVLFFQGIHSSLQLTVEEWANRADYVGVRSAKLVAFGSKGTQYEIFIHDPNMDI